MAVKAVNAQINNQALGGTTDHAWGRWRQGRGGGQSGQTGQSSRDDGSKQPAANAVDGVDADHASDKGKAVVPQTWSKA